MKSSINQPKFSVTLSQQVFQPSCGTSLQLRYFYPLSWLLIVLLPSSLTALTLGVILLDLAVQAVHVTNQSLIFAVRPEARRRLVGGYMVFYSIGSAIGAIASTTVYGFAGWTGVSLLGSGFSSIAFLFWVATHRVNRGR